MRKVKYLVIYVAYLIHVIWLYPWLSDLFYEKSSMNFSFPLMQFFLLTITYIITGVIGGLMITIPKNVLYELVFIDIPIILLLNTYTLYSQFSIILTNYKYFDFYVSISAILFGIETVRYIKYFKKSSA